MKYLFILVFAIIGGCGGTLLQPDSYTIEEINSEPIDLITSRGLQIAVYDDFLTDHGIQSAKETLHNELDFYIDCMGLDPEIVYGQVVQYKVVLVPRTYECLFGQHEVCHGTWSGTHGFIVVAKDRPLTNEDYPLWKHEIAHMTGDYRTDHSNLTDQLKECIVYP